MVQEQLKKKIEFPVFITAQHLEMSLPHPNHNKSNIITQIPTSCFAKQLGRTVSNSFYFDKKK